MLFLTNLKNKVPEKFRFSVFVLLMGFVLPTIFSIPDFIELIETKARLANDTEVCFSENAANKNYVCDAEILYGVVTEDNKQNHIQWILAKGYGEYENEIISIREDYSFALLFAFLISLLPFFWVFFLIRFADVANAIRGNKN